MMCFVQYQELICEAALLQTQVNAINCCFSACFGATQQGVVVFCFVFRGEGQVRIKFIILPKFTLKFDFKFHILDFVDTVYVSLSFNDSYLCQSFLICF